MDGKAMDNYLDQLKQMADTGSYEGAIALAKELGVEVDEQLDADIKAYFDKKAGRLLSDDELDGVAGGEINWGNGQGRGDQSNKDDVRFAFNVGDVVEVWGIFGTARAVITERRLCCIDDWWAPTWYEPRYHVEFFDKGRYSSESWIRQDYLSY